MDERSSSPEGSGPAQAEAGDAADRLEALETRARDARGATENRPVVEAGRLVDVEGDLLALTQDLGRVHPHLADDRGHPVLADLGRWQSRCRRLGLEAADRKAAALHEDLVDDEAERWRRAVRAAVGRADPQACFDLLTEAAVLDGEILSRQGAQPESPPLAGERGPLREGLAAAIEAYPPTDEDRDRWTTSLLDRADVVLTAIDELAPAAADARLGIVADDLRWHLHHVEPQRSSRRRHLKRKLRRVIAEQQERGLQGRLEGMFGRVNVGRFERTILWLIFLVLALLAVESIFDLSAQVKEIFLVIDTLACLVFLWDFFLRLTLVKGKGRWFLRHFFVDFLPSIPVGLLAWQPIRLGRALRFLRLARVARYVRFLMPVIRMTRAIGFLSRGVDRVVRRYGHLLNRDVILYPTREEKGRALAARQDTVTRLRRLHAEVNDLWVDLLASAHGADRDAVAATRVDGLARARERGLAERPAERAQRVVATREIPAEILLRRLEGATAEGIAADLGPDFISRAARAVRVFSRPPLRWIPFLGGWFPQLGPAMSDAEITAATAHQAAARLRRHHDRWFWFADLYGTITPAEFVDGVGSTMVRSALRPAYKLVLFGGGYLLVLLFLLLLPGGFFEWLRQVLEKLLGNTLLVLGGICAVILGIGWWLRRLAQQATAFFEQVALAQYLPLTESIKGRFLERDAALFARRVLAPEALLKGEAPESVAPNLRERFVRAVRGWLLEAHASGDARGAFDAMERSVLLYRDGLDGGLLHESDTRTTNQLLGNPALRHLQETAGCVNQQEQKALHALDLENQRRFFGGPYFWFSLVTGAVAQSVAHLIVEYNRQAIPLVELKSATDEARARYEAWIAGLEFDGEDPEHAQTVDTSYVTASFTALHFLDDDERRDGEVRERFGPVVLAHMQRDRQRLVRRIFGTYPLHTRPHEVRVVNLYRTYEEYLAGGRALLLPLRGLWAAIRWIWRIVGWIAAAVRQIRNPPRPDEYQKEAEADFLTAVRKIDRMRGPVVRACLWLRARVDAEYLGVRLPGTRRTGLEGVTVARDLAFLDAPAELRRQVEAQHDLAQADMRRLARLLDQGLFGRIAKSLGVDADELTREHLRSAAFAYRADIAGVRSLLSAADVLREAAAEAAHQPALKGGLWLQPKLYATLRRWWKSEGRGGRRERSAAWRAAMRDMNGAGRALRVMATYDDLSDAAREGERRLTELLRHPGRMSGQLVTLRAVQTQALIDMLTYRTHVWRLGHYETDGDDPGDLLTLD